MELYYTKTNVQLNLNHDGKIIGEIGPRSDMEI